MTTDLIVRDVCETDPEDAEHPEAICVRSDVLAGIVEKYAGPLEDQLAAARAENTRLRELAGEFRRIILLDKINGQRDIVRALLQQIEAELGEGG